MEDRKKEAALKRIEDLLILQGEISAKYGEDGYNVFVFGSYPTTGYKENESDADIAVYTSDFELYKKIAGIIEIYFWEKGVKTDIFYIDLTVPAPFFVAPLRAQIQFTDYYPKELEDFKNVCEEKLKQIKEKIVA